jgi:hypothetical protein
MYLFYILLIDEYKIKCSGSSPDEETLGAGELELACAHVL